jgi:uncharacterized protein (DUF58 family)
MNTLMVKEFDEGISAEAWVVLDLQRSVHAGSDPADNTEEMGVNIAASVCQRLVELGMPVGLAANGEDAQLIRPDSNPGQLGTIMEALAQASALGRTSLERFIYDLRPQLSHFNTVTVITPSCRREWVTALVSLRRQGVKVAAVLMDPREFGRADRQTEVLEALMLHQVPTYPVQRGQALNAALSRPRPMTEAQASAGPQETAQPAGAAP